MKKKMDRERKRVYLSDGTKALLNLILLPVQLTLITWWRAVFRDRKIISIFKVAFFILRCYTPLQLIVIQNHEF